MSNQVQAPKEPKFFITTEEILNGTLSYLATRPYQEVAHIVDALRQSQPHTPVVAEDKEETNEAVNKNAPALEKVEE